MIYMKKLHPFYAVLEYPENLANIQLNSLQTPYRPIQVHYTHEPQNFMTQLGIEPRVVPRDFVDFFGRIDLDDFESWICRFGVIYGSLVYHVGNIISNEVIICVVIVYQIDCRLAKYDIEIVKVIMANLDMLLRKRQQHLTKLLSFLQYFQDLFHQKLVVWVLVCFRFKFSNFFLLLFAEKIVRGSAEKLSFQGLVVQLVESVHFLHYFWQQRGSHYFLMLWASCLREELRD